MKTNRFPKGWNEKRVRKVLRHYEAQTDDAAAEEDAKLLKGQVIVQVPRELMPAIRELIRVYQAHGKS